MAAALSAVDKMQNGIVGDIKAPVFWPSKSAKQMQQILLTL